MQSQQNHKDYKLRSRICDETYILMIGVLCFVGIMYRSIWIVYRSLLTGWSETCSLSQLIRYVRTLLVLPRVYCPAQHPPDYENNEKIERTFCMKDSIRYTDLELFASYSKL